MKTISLRELHNNTGKWVRAAKEGREISVTDRGEEIAMIVPKRAQAERKVDWKNRKLVPGFAKYLKEGKRGSDSTDWISEERSAMDNRGANG
jgi:prevent-host-death family protein